MLPIWRITLCRQLLRLVQGLPAGLVGPVDWEAVCCPLLEMEVPVAPVVSVARAARVVPAQMLSAQAGSVVTAATGGAAAMEVKAVAVARVGCRASMVMAEMGVPAGVLAPVVTVVPVRSETRLHQTGVMAETAAVPVPPVAVVRVARPVPAVAPARLAAMEMPVSQCFQAAMAVWEGVVMTRLQM